MTSEETRHTLVLVHNVRHRAGDYFIVNLIKNAKQSEIFKRIITFKEKKQLSTLVLVHSISHRVGDYFTINLIKNTKQNEIFGRIIEAQ